MELVQDVLRGLRMGADVYSAQEEVCETVIPDMLPDAARVADTITSVTLRDWLPREGGAEIRAAAHVHVICAAEEADGAEKEICVDTMLSFTHHAELPGVPADAELLCEAELVSADARLLNPRKLFVRVEISFRTRAFVREERAITVGTSGEEGLMTLTQEARIRLMTGTGVRNFTVIGELPLAGADPAQPLCYTVTPEHKEAVCADGRLTVRGDAAFRMLYRDSGGAVRVFEGSIPFEQVMEMPSVTEDTVCETVLTLKNAEMDKAQDAEGQDVLAVTVGVCAQNVLYETRTLHVLTDAYSTAQQTALKREKLAYEEPAVPWKQRTTVTEKIELPDPAARLVDWRIIPQGGAETDGSTVTQAVLLQAVYEGDDGQICGLSRRIPVSFPAPPCRTENLRIRIEDPGISLNGGLEVRFSAQAEGCAVQERSLEMITGIEHGEEVRTENSPSLILRFPADETLWTLAKEYHAPLDAVCRLNGLETPEDLPADRQIVTKPILIPVMQ